MSKQDMNRRDFNKLSMAALGGMMAGSLIGCEPTEEKKADEKKEDATKDEAKDTNKDQTKAEKKEEQKDNKDVTQVTSEKHACMGLNSCKGLGKTGKNECAGQGQCATVEHTCAGENECKYLSGCQGKAGINECKGQGGCHVPMDPTSDDWKQARAAFEKRMTEKGKTVGKAPISMGS